MAYATPTQFRKLVLTKKPEELVDECFFQGVPYIFRSDANRYSMLRAALGNALAVASNSITIVGSARLGFSASPQKFGTAFGPESDVDVIVVSEDLFDRGWRDLLRWHYAWKWSMPAYRAERVIIHHEQSIYWGHIWPDLLLKISDIVLPWRSAFRSLSQIPELSPFKLNGRLYRTWEHARLYHVDSVRALAASFKSETRPV